MQPALPGRAQHSETNRKWISSWGFRGCVARSGRTKAFTSLFAGWLLPGSHLPGVSQAWNLQASFRATPIRGRRHVSVCAYNRWCNTRAKGHFHAQVTCLAAPTHGSNFFYSPFSSLHLSISLFLPFPPRPFWLPGERILEGGRKGIPLAKYVSTCLHILDLYVEYSRRSVVGQRNVSRTFLRSASAKKEHGEVLSFIHESWGPYACVSVSSRVCSILLPNFKSGARLPSFFLNEFPNAVPKHDEDGNFSKKSRLRSTTR